MEEFKKFSSEDEIKTERAKTTREFKRLLEKQEDRAGRLDSLLGRYKKLFQKLIELENLFMDLNHEAGKEIVEDEEKSIFFEITEEMEHVEKRIEKITYLLEKIDETTEEITRESEETQEHLISLENKIEALNGLLGRQS